MTSSYNIERFHSNCKVAIKGALTAILVPELSEALKREIQRNVRELVFDMRETRMLDSSGIGFLIASRNDLDRRGAIMRVINASPEVLDLLRRMRLVSRLDVSPATELS